MGDGGAQGEPTGPAWTAGAVARRLGIAPATLRSWNQRYQLGPATHQPGRHRRYTEQDVAMLETMCRLIGEGVVPAAAARLARSARPAAPPEPTEPTGQHPAGHREAGPHAGTDGDGRVTEHLARGWVQAALRLDADTLTRSLDHQLATHGLEATWQQACVPALTALGRKVTPAGDCVDAVHLLSWVIITGLHRHIPAVPSSPRRRVLLACADRERHSLGLEALHAVLASHGIAARMLGPSVPAPALAAAAERTRPAAVVVWAQVSRTARTGSLRPLTHSARQVIAAGPGWRLTRPPVGVLRVDSLPAAVAAIRDAVRIHDRQAFDGPSGRERATGRG